jgi:drug/metabolite transporter (DMT)-like permease
MLLLTVVCTNLAFVLNLQAMKKLSAFTANIAINLEPVYGIILAAFIFNENQNLNLMFYIGTAIILATVFLHPIFRSIAEKKFPKKQVP